MEVRVEKTAKGGSKQMKSRESNIRKIIVSLMILVMSLSIALLSACGGGADESAESEVKAADPMTEEELKEVDPSDGCVDEDNDSLY